MLDPSKRFATLVLAAGVLVLLLAIVLGESMGQNVLRNAVGQSEATVPVAITPNPAPSSAAYGPNWTQPEALAAAPDPRFPDPRVPPAVVPTPRPTPSPRPVVVVATPTPNMAIPIWRRLAPLPTTAPSDQHLVPQSDVTPAPRPQDTVPGPSPAPPKAMLHP
ncbi:MAG TPA: hypothetical protein VIJ12_07455 [Candidatus Baltobacteraceae bacterium]